MNKIVIKKDYFILKSEKFNLCEEMGNVSLDEDGFLIDENGSPLIYNKESGVIEPFSGISLKKDSNNEMVQFLINNNDGNFLCEKKSRYNEEVEKRIDEIENKFGLLGVIVGSKENPGLENEGIKDIEVLKSEENLNIIKFVRDEKKYSGVQFELEDEEEGHVYLTYVLNNDIENLNLKEVLEGIEELEEINSKAYEN